jgi:hypothetical protein
VPAHAATACAATATARIERIDAIAYLSGPLQAKIHSYKYGA